MKSVMKKTTLREIRHSFGRFFAILAIIALGVGFYAGLTVTKSAMIQTTDHYLSDKGFFDLRLLSTWGFEQEDIDSFAAMEDVAGAEGAYFQDVLYINEEGNEGVIKVHSITEGINELTLKAGRFPENDRECVVDSNLYRQEALGTKLTISDNNTQDTRDVFAHREYTIVGIVQSSYYMNFERGTTSIGNGKAEGFAYLLPEGFVSDYFMEVFVRFDNQNEIFSEEYENHIEEKKDLWEQVSQERVQNRYNEVLAEAQEELSDAKTSLEDEKVKAETELSDALDELTQAEEQIADGKQQIMDAKAEISKQKKELEELEQSPLAADPMMQGQLALGREQIAAAEAQIKGQEMELTEAEEKAKEGRLEYEKASEEFDEKIAEAETEIADAETEIEEIEEPDTYVLDRNTNLGYACFESDSGIVEGIAKVFPLFFFLVAALVCITTMNRMVEEQRTQIGVLKALGYGETVIMSKYMFYSGSAAVVGCMLGYFIGTYGFPRVIWTAYGIMYNLVPLEYVFDVKLLVISVLVSLFCSIGTTWFSCRYELAEVAAELMRPKAPKAGKRVLLERIPFIWKRLKFLHKVSVRNIFRYKRRFLMMVIGISGCSALLVTGMGIKDSISNIADAQYSEIMPYDADVTFKDAQKPGEENEFTQKTASSVGSFVYTAQKSVDLTVKNKVKSVSMVIMEKETDIGEFIDFHTEKGEPLTYPGEGEVLISSKLARNYGLKLGDEVVLRDENMKEIRVKVSGIFENFIYDYAYINKDTYVNQIEEQPEYKSAYVNFTDEGEVHAGAVQIMDVSSVASVSVNQDMRERIGSMMSSLNYIVLTVIACAALLAFIVLYNLTNINITERIREIATIKVLGFYKNETALYVFRENMVLTAIGALVGLFLGKWLHTFVMNQINIDMIAFDIRVSPLSYLLSVILTFVFAWTVNLVMSSKIERINMAESLKSVD